MTRWLAALLAMALSAGAQNFTFWQMSDLHSPLAPSGVTIAAARDLANGKLDGARLVEQRNGLR